MSALSARPLDAAGIDRLEALLLQRALPFGGLNLEALDGLLSAVSVGPQELPDAAWQGLVWGKHPPRWRDEEEAAEVQALLDGHLALVRQRLRHGAEPPADLTPLVGFPEDIEATLAGTGEDDGSDVGYDWAVGFFRGASLCEAEWDGWANAEDWIADALEDIGTLLALPEDGDAAGARGRTGNGAAHEDGAAVDDADAGADDAVADDADDADADSDDEAPGFEERMRIVFDLPGILADLHAHRIEHLTPRTPIRRDDAPGRNDPCSCGSGKKFKKCCGA